MRKKSVGKSFRKINLAHTDDFGPKNDKIRLWVINNGGTFSKELNDGVTHLVCSRKAWKGYHNVGELTSFKTILQPITSTLPQ
jgi:twin BRCT domain